MVRWQVQHSFIHFVIDQLTSEILGKCWEEICGWGNYRISQKIKYIWSAWYVWQSRYNFSLGREIGRKKNRIKGASICSENPWIFLDSCNTEELMVSELPWSKYLRHQQWNRYFTSGIGNCTDERILIYIGLIVLIYWDLLDFGGYEYNKINQINHILSHTCRIRSFTFSHQTCDDTSFSVLDTVLGKA